LQLLRDPKNVSGTVREAIKQLDKGIFAPLARKLANVTGGASCEQLDEASVCKALALFVPVYGDGTAEERASALRSFINNHAQVAHP